MIKIGIDANQYFTTVCVLIEISPESQVPEKQEQVTRHNAGVSHINEMLSNPDADEPGTEYDVDAQYAEQQRAIMEDPSYLLAHVDHQLLADENSRPIRMQLELLKPERYLRRHDIHSTVVVFGSARTCSPERAKAELDRLESTDNPSPADLNKARIRLRQAHYYEQAERFARLISSQFQTSGRRHLVVVTGGGGGVMEAANRGATNAGARSIGFNITLPREQTPNPFITPGLCFQFRYFGLRKMHFLLRARALVFFPGGFGTLDELFEVLTLVQTRKVQRVPIVLVGSAYWTRAVNFDLLVEEYYIHKEDAELVSIVETAEEILSVISDFYAGRPDERREQDSTLSDSTT
jgi:uncharacterized protein (TIGR00730 family)